jgi:hypothetical protein
MPGPAIAIPSRRPPAKAGFWLALSVGFAASLGLMVAASRGALSLDEVLSLETALGARNWFSLLCQPTDDNNHLLNAVCLRLLGWQPHLIVYRIPAILFGGYTLLALAFTARRWGRAAILWTVYLAGLSFPIILYCSEARGYAAAMFFAVLSFELLQCCWEQPTWGRIILFWVVLCLGFAAHFTFANVLVALGGWAVIRERNRGTPVRAAVLRLARLFAPPAVFVAVVYLVIIRHLAILGGPIYTEREVIGAAAAHALGLPDTAHLRVVAVAGCALLAICGLWHLVRRNRPEWTYFALVLFFAPLLMTLLTPSKYLTFRYFMVCFPFFYLLLAFLFVEWCRRPGIFKLLPVALILCMTTGHLLKLQKLVDLGRGNFLQALNDMAGANRTPLIRVSSDSDFKNGKLLHFYGLLLPAKKVEYIPHDQITAERPDWLVVTYLPDYPSLLAGNSLRYDLFSYYPFCGLSGLSWSVYRLANESQTNNHQFPAAPRSR